MTLSFIISTGRTPRLQTSAGRAGAYAGGPRLSNKQAVFKDFSLFVRQDSIDKASDGGYVDDWYFQAYAMVRFLFKPYNARYPENRMKFEQLVKEFNTARRVDAAATEAALKKVYGYKNIKAFEDSFYRWLYALQKSERERLIREAKKPK